MTEADKPATPPAAGVWGVKAPQFYAPLRGKTVAVKIVTGEILKGVLLGVDVYDLVLRQETGLTLLLPKGNIVYVHAAQG